MSKESARDQWSDRLFNRAVKQYIADALEAYAQQQAFARFEQQQTLALLQRTEWSPEFERLMRNRMVMGALRYGLIAEKRIKGKKWDLVEPIAKKVALYERTGNTEYLVDAANYCLLAFECDDHPKKHFQALDDHHDHCQLRNTDIPRFNQ